MALQEDADRAAVRSDAASQIKSLQVLGQLIPKIATGWSVSIFWAYCGFKIDIARNPDGADAYCTAEKRSLFDHRISADGDRRWQFQVPKLGHFGIAR